MATARMLCLLVGLLICSAVCATAACEQQYSQRTARILHKAGTAITAGDNRKALGVLEEFIAAYPAEEHFILFSYLGNLYVRENRSGEALQAYDQALTFCRKDVALWRNHARAAWDLKQYDRAADSLLEAWRLEPSDELLFNLALARIHAGEKESAAKLLEELLDRAPVGTDFNRIETFIGVCLDLNAAGRGLAALRRWQSRYEHEPRFWQLRAILHVRLNDYVRGAACLKIMASFGDLRDDDKRLLADLLLQIKVPLLAAELYEQLLADKPDDFRLLEQLVVAYRVGGRPEQALGTLEKALKYKKTAELLRQKGEVCFALERYREAFAVFEALTESGSASGRVSLYQAYCALKMERHDLARGILKRAMKFKQQRQEAERLLAWLQKSEVAAAHK